MGIRGLTTFIQNRSHLYMEKLELHDSNLVIDGNAVACQLYKWHCTSNDCFGGDYDKFANIITNFFQILSDCNVTPYVVFDGGYETRKVATVVSRMKNKIQSAEQLSSVPESSITVFPLFLREVFQDVVVKSGIKSVRCDFEGDTEIASIARTLNCPCTSYDSDFFIFDVLYIPFSTFEMCVRKKKTETKRGKFNYIACEVYRVENFLKSFGGLNKSNLPILAVLLGNDYIKRGIFSLFFQHLKIQKSHNYESEQQKRIKSLIIWLQNETTESAISKVLSRYTLKRRSRIAQKIQNAIKGYNSIDSKYLKYLEIIPNQPREICEVNINILSDELNETDEDNLSGEEECSSEDDLDCFPEELVPKTSQFFFENFRKLMYPPCFMDMLIQNRYYCTPQVENSSLEHSHSVSLEIISVIYKILPNSSNNLVCLVRNQNNYVKKQVLPLCNIEVPTLQEVQHFDLDSRKYLFLKVLGIEENFINCIQLFPDSWHLFIICIKYLTNKFVMSFSLIQSLLLCKVILNYVDPQVGFYRSIKKFDKKFGLEIQNIVNNKEISNCIKKDTIEEALTGISFNDSLILLQRVLPNFQMDVKMKINHKLFDRNLVHSMAQFQSCFLHIKYLNQLLNLPYSNFNISDCYNGTFIYNLTTNLKKRTNVEDYISILLKNAPTVLNSLTLINNQIKEFTRCQFVHSESGKRKKKRKKRNEVSIIQSDENIFVNEEFIYDPNNKFSLLSVS